MYFVRREVVRAWRPASDSAVSGGCPPRQAMASNSCPRQQCGEVAGEVVA